MKRLLFGLVCFVGFVTLLACNVYSAPLPPPPTAVGGDFWPYVTTGAVLGLGVLRMWRK